MSKRKITLLVLAVVMAVGLTGGIVWAQTGGGTPTPTPTSTTGGGTPTPTPEATPTTSKTFVARVAEILDLEESTVQDAFTEAKRDQIDESYRGRLDKMVEQGRLTEDEADEQYSWFQARPDHVVERSKEHRRGRQGFQRRGFNKGEGRWEHRGGRRGRGGCDMSPMTPSPTTEQPSS